MSTLELVMTIAVASLGSGGVAALLHLRLSGKKTESETGMNYTAAQSTIIDSLQTENERLSEDISELRREVAELRGHLEAMERLKVDEIARRTAQMVVAELVGEPDIEVNGG